MSTPRPGKADGLDRALAIAIAVAVGLLTGLVPAPSVDPRSIGSGVGTAFDSITAIILVGV
ncbi:MAG TPA: hypothetical protein VET90_08040, partial [Candidatus Binatus sp.]|nr:hypothetical protein [Candidatus Binatus sp.]